MNGGDERNRGFERLLTEALRRSDSPASSCPDVEVIAALAEKRLGRAELRDVETHLASCARCRETMVLLARSAPEALRTPLLPGLASWRPMIGALATASIAVVLAIRFFPEGAEPVPEGARSAEQAAPAVLEPAPAAPPGLAATSDDRQNRRRADLDAGKKALREPADAFADRVAPAEARDESARGGAASVGEPRAGARPADKEQALAKAAPRKLEAPKPASVGRAAAENRAAPTAALSAAESNLESKSKSDEPRRERDAAAGATAQTAMTEEAEARPRGHGGWRVADGDLERSTDGGRTWQPVPLLSDAELVALAVADGEARWVVGERGTVFRSEDGETWTRCVAPTAEDLLGVAALDRVDGAVVTARSGARFETRDGGKSWSAR